MKGTEKHMIKFTLTTSLPLAILLLCGPSQTEAQGATPITIKDGGSILLHADGLDAGKNWKVIGSSELRHLIANGVLSGLQITEAGADRCAGNATCGIDASKPWKIKVTYDARVVTISSVSANKGLHLKFSAKIPFTQWQKTAAADEREFGHGDGRHIGSIKVNGSATSLCSGKGGCEVIVTYTTPQ
jgi:hypothetical protein